MVAASCSKSTMWWWALRWLGNAVMSARTATVGPCPDGPIALSATRRERGATNSALALIRCRPPSNPPSDGCPSGATCLMPSCWPSKRRGCSGDDAWFARLGCLPMPTTRGATATATALGLAASIVDALAPPERGVGRHRQNQRKHGDSMKAAILSIAMLIVGGCATYPSASAVSGDPPDQSAACADIHLAYSQMVTTTRNERRGNVERCLVDRGWNVVSARDEALRIVPPVLRGWYRR